MANTDLSDTHALRPHRAGWRLSLWGLQGLYGAPDIEFQRSSMSGVWVSRPLTIWCATAFTRAVGALALFADVDEQGGTAFVLRQLNGQILTYGGHRLRVIATPGRSPGHMCLHDEENAIIFLGDHLIQHHANIASWPGYEDSLGDYIRAC